MKNISVLGCGRWGSFLAWYLVNRNFPVTLWGREDSKSFLSLKNEGKNEYVNLDKRITLSSDLGEAVNSAEIIVISISSQGLDSFMKRVTEYDVKDKLFVLCMKGVEVSTGRRLSTILEDNGIDRDKIAVWVGPGHIQAFTQGIPNCMVIDSYNDELKKYFAETFSSGLIRFYYGDDMIGTEIGAAAKNVMGILAGVLDGVGYPSLKGPLMSRGAREVSRLIIAMGGKEHSAYGLAHLGDYETTLFSPYSHNRAYGEALVSGKKFSLLAEGVPTSAAIMTLAKKYGVDMPLTKAVYEVCYSKNITDYPSAVKEVISKLFSRNIKTEFYI